MEGKERALDQVTVTEDSIYNMLATERECAPVVFLQLKINNEK